MSYYIIVLFVDSTDVRDKSVDLTHPDAKRADDIDKLRAKNYAQVTTKTTEHGPKDS